MAFIILVINLSYYCFSGLTYEEVLSFVPPSLDDEMESWGRDAFCLLFKFFFFQCNTLLKCSISRDYPYFFLFTHTMTFKCLPSFISAGRCDTRGKKQTKAKLWHPVHIVLWRPFCVPFYPPISSHLNLNFSSVSSSDFWFFFPVFTLKTVNDNKSEDFTRRVIFLKFLLLCRNYSSRKLLG